MYKKNVIAICGSTRHNSINHSLINAISHISVQDLNISVYSKIGNLPQFNPDDDDENVAKEVTDFRRQLDQADGILICTPEYAHGVPGSLKNAIDWTVSSSNFTQKPTMLVTASTDGKYGHAALLETLKAIDAKNVDSLQMVIEFAKTKVSLDGRITDDDTLIKISTLLSTFVGSLYVNTETEF
ncbi:MAG: NADPH-dependent reductase [Pedobacter sp.]|jgi:chromate reductase|nr:NADPH-dependent reductase [Pedobacter sp.]